MSYVAGVVLGMEDTSVNKTHIPSHVKHSREERPHAVIANKGFNNVQIEMQGNYRVL